MAMSILEGRYITIIENAVKEAFGKKLKVVFVYSRIPKRNRMEMILHR
jgi:hypothetical protein